MTTLYYPDVLTRAPAANTPPRRFRFSVLEATAAASYAPSSKPLTNAICKNCKQSDHLVQRPLVDPVHIYFCTNCGQLTPTRAIRHKRGLMAPTLQQGTEPGNTGIAQPGNTDVTDRKRTPRGIYTAERNNADPIITALRAKGPGFTILDSQTIEPTG